MQCFVGEIVSRNGGWSILRMLGCISGSSSTLPRRQDSWGMFVGSCLSRSVVVPDIPQGERPRSEVLSSSTSSTPRVGRGYPDSPTKPPIHDVSRQILSSRDNPGPGPENWPPKVSKNVWTPPTLPKPGYYLKISLPTPIEISPT